jgi:hypothetical protein
LTRAGATRATINRMDGLSTDERAELERLRRQTAGGGRAVRGWRWAGASAVLVVAAVLATAGVFAVYLRGQVLDTDTYVETVAPLGQDPVVRGAVAQRLTDELVTRSDLTGLANQLAGRLEAEGAPARLSDLVGPLVSGVSSFLNGKINQLMATERFETAWVNANRVAHEGLVTVLTGGQGQVLSSQGDTVTIDLGELLTLVKQQLVTDGLTIFGKIPDVSIPYTLVQSDKLPQIRSYARALDLAGTWLPWIALIVLLAGILIAPNRRRGLLIGTVLTGLTALLALGVVTLARTYYVDNLPPTVRSPEAASIVLTTLLRYLVAALQTLAAAMGILALGAFLAGPNGVAVWVRRWVTRGLDAAGRLLARAGAWVVRIGHALAVARRPIQVGLVLLALVVLILANRPGIPGVLWATFAVLAAAAVAEVFARAATNAG